jgi:hypothetical protein
LVRNAQRPVRNIQSRPEKFACIVTDRANARHRHGPDFADSDHDPAAGKDLVCARMGLFQICASSNARAWLWLAVDAEYF